MKENIDWGSQFQMGRVYDFMAGSMIADRHGAEEVTESLHLDAQA